MLFGQWTNILALAFTALLARSAPTDSIDTDLSNTTLVSTTSIPEVDPNNIPSQTQVCHNDSETLPLNIFSCRLLRRLDRRPSQRLRQKLRVLSGPDWPSLLW
ncbi:hypothetical protein SISSUDRAFT_644026 [Sistotremastrum suecicum HHB10207 ss-3]|uniref:Secreted protein n=1 Tax=Sistotremastrum suecicum HHB10207 ss-3 TaxID=1314776 RepID=A0A165X621_9AGAM|nr:hypothetical protein SISSUDRAFT_644026 [Sistotremastrum suecicum HHB10207 ss-3]